MKKDFTIGRNDFSLTVYVPWNCTNNCKFCSSKKDYNIIKPDFNAVKKELKKVRNSLISIVVFTGGEPSVEVEKLAELIKIVDNKIVYINTTLPKKNSDKFIDLINSTECIKGVSISRHKTTYLEDTKLLHDICDDKTISKIKKPVRINVVNYEVDGFNIDNIKKYVKRWSKIRKNKSEDYRSLYLNLRSNYVVQTKYNLHEMEDDKIINALTNNYYYQGHTFCNVCDTCTFLNIKNGKRDFQIDYHRGLLTTSLKFGNVIEVNDLILLQDGNMCYDWDGSKDNIKDLLKLLDIRK